MNRVANLLMEYGERVNGDSASEAHYKEHMEHLVPKNALQKLKTV